MAVRFTDTIGRILPKKRIRDLCLAAELSETETAFMLHRCAEEKSREQIQDLHGISLSSQRSLVKQVDTKVFLWLLHNMSEFLSRAELAALSGTIEKYQVAVSNEVKNSG